MTRVRLGFIGAGWWATTNHMPLLAGRDDVEMVGVASLGREMLLKVQDMFGFKYIMEDYHELLELELDGVVVSTPHYLHYEHAKAALIKGKHVLTEKPFTLRAWEGWDLVRTATSQGKEILIPYGWNYRPFTRQAKALMDAGVIGRIEYVLCHMASPTKGLFGGGGTVFTGWEPTIAEADPRTWQDPQRGGGYAHGQITHSSALLFWLTGQRAAEVSARMSYPNSRVDMYDAAHIAFDDGSIGTISGAATLPERDAFQLDIRIFGAEGALLLDVERERLEVRRHDGHHQHYDVPSGEGAYTCTEPPHRFVEVIKGVGRNDSSGEVGAKTVELIEAMHESTRCGGLPVRVFRD